MTQRSSAPALSRTNRRGFFKTTAQAAVVGAGVSTSTWPAVAAASPASSPKTSATPAILRDYTAADHQRRLENIATCHRSIGACMRQHLITNYLPGQCTYNLGEYPCRKPWDPDDWDEQELDKLRDEGIRIVQVHEEWNDSQRFYGGHKLAPLNPAGFRRFVDMVHRRDMKLLVYVSSGFFQRTDPDFRPEWAIGADLVEIYFDYACCSAASPGWRGYFLPRLVRILDEYGVDGIYNDLGYRQPGSDPTLPPKDEVLAFEESRTSDGALGDLLALIYDEVKRRSGIVKVHLGGAGRPHTDLKVYDYLWVGEGGRSGDRLRDAVKNYPPYVVPCLDMSRATVDNEDERFLHAIPYLQFPLLLAGRPFTGERALIAGIKYPRGEECFWTRHCRAIWKHYQAHPNGPYSYGWWDSTPGRPEARPTHARWLKQYLPLVEEGTWAWLEVQQSQLFAGSLPKDVVASVFANRALHVVLANYGRTAADVPTADAYVPMDNPTASPKKQWKLPPRSLKILRRQV